jgi:hypothetical protein
MVAELPFFFNASAVSTRVVWSAFLAVVEYLMSYSGMGLADLTIDGNEKGGYWLQVDLSKQTNLYALLYMHRRVGKWVGGRLSTRLGGLCP